MAPSPNKKVNQVDISEDDRAFAVLIASGLFTQAAAHRVIFKDSKLKDDSQRRMLGSNLAKRPHVISYIQVALLSYVQEKNKASSGVGGFQDDFMTGENGQMTKDDIRRLMTANIFRETDPAKQNKLAESLAILDGQRGNNDTGVSDEQRLMYVPARCVEHCKLYKAEKERREKL